MECAQLFPGPLSRDEWAEEMSRSDRAQDARDSVMDERAIPASAGMTRFRAGFPRELELRTV